MNKLHTSVHICDTDRMNMNMILRVFTSYKLNQGFIPCSEAEAEITYLVSHSESDVCNWITICGSHWQNNDYDAASDPLALSRIFGRYSVRFVADHSGSAFIELADPDERPGDSAGAKIIGNSLLNQYNNTEIKEEIWSRFLRIFTDESTFSRFIKNTYRSEIEIAKCLSALFHIREEQLLADADSELRNCECAKLHFKKLSDGIKKVSIRSVFKKIYGESLKPLGFAYAKTKEPCYIRLLNEEIVQIIGIHDNKPDLIVPFGGVMTVYRADLMLNKAYRNNATSLPRLWQFWKWFHKDSDDCPDPRIFSNLRYLLQSPDSVVNTMRAALTETERWILPVLNSVRSIQDIPDYYEKCYGAPFSFRKLPLKTTDPGDFRSDDVIRYLLGNLEEQYERYSIELEKDQAANPAFDPNLNSPADIRNLRDWFKGEDEALRRSVDLFENDPEMKQQTLTELQRRKKLNLEALHSYGVL